MHYIVMEITSLVMENHGVAGLYSKHVPIVPVLVESW